MRSYPALALVMIAALMLGACSFGVQSDQPDVAQQPTDVAASDAPTAEAGSVATITFGAESPMRHVYQPLIDVFNSQNPGIHVQFVSLDSAYQSGDYAEQMRQIVGLADTAEAGVSEQEFNAGLLHDLKPLMDADPQFNPDDFYPSALANATTSGGAIFQLPQTLEVPLLFYNKDLWAARGLAAPKADWTWQDVEAAAQQLAEKRGDVTVYGLADEEAQLAVLLAELKNAGLDLATTPPADARVDQPEVMAALERVAGLFSSGTFFLPPQNADVRDAIAQLVVDQRVAMWGSRGSGDLATLQKRSGATSPNFALGVAPYPLLPGGTRDFTNGYVISSGTQHPNEAWAWLAFLSHQQIDSLSAKGNALGAINVLPARKSMADASGYWSHLNEEAKAAMQAALNQPTPDTPASSTLDAYAPLLQAVRDIARGTNAAQAAGEAQAAIHEQAAQAHEVSTAAPSEPVVVATPAPNVAPPGATTITFGMPLIKGGDASVRVAQQFNQSDQGVFVQLQDTFTGNDILPISQTAAQTDCFASPFEPAQTELTATLDLQPLLDADSTFQIDDYPAALLTPYRANGQLHGLPWGVNFRVLVYNQNLFEAANVPPPTAQWTTDELLDTAQKLTGGQGDSRQYGLVIPRSIPMAAKFLVHLFGAPTVTGSGDTLKPAFTDPKVVQAARTVVDLFKNSTPHINITDNRSTDDYGPLTGDGRAAMWFAWGLYSYGQDKPSFTMAMAPPPLAQAVLDGDDVSTSGMFISARTDKQQACWTWLKYLSTTTIAGNSNIPARRSVAQSDALNQEQPGMAAVYAAYAAALDRGGQLAPGDDVPGTPQIDYYWFYRALDQALQGKNLESELAEAQALTEQYVACVRAGGDRQTCDEQIDPSYGQANSSP